MSTDDPPGFQVSKRMSRHVVRATVAVAALSLAVLSSPISLAQNEQPERAEGGGEVELDTSRYLRERFSQRVDLP